MASPLPDDRGARPISTGSPTSPTRTDRDAMGEMRVPANADYGASPRRAVLDLRISGLRLPRAFIRALGLVKSAPAGVNAELGLLGRRPPGEGRPAHCR